VNVCAGRGAEPTAPRIKLVDVTAQSQITFRHTAGGSGKQYIVEFMVGGLALFDYDGDSLIDVYFTNGTLLPGTVAEVPPTDALYRNNGDGTWTDVTKEAGVGERGHGMGVTAADYDQDGDQDLYISNFGPNVLYRNNGDGTFTDVTESAGGGRGHKVGAGVAFLDIEGDGNLDLYVGNYLDFTYDRHARLAPKSYPFPPGPADFPPVADQLFRNDGDGRFTEISQESGIGRSAGPSMGLVCGDFDLDGDTDVFVCNDAVANFLFVNDGRGAFTERAVLAGVAFDLLGNPNGSMGVDCADYNQDGLPDLFMSDYTNELPVLYHNLGGGMFEDATRRTQAGIKAFPHVNWGTGLVDFDNDGDRDLFIANGHFLVDIDKTDQRTAFKMANMLLANLQGKRFADVSDQCGNGLAVVESSRGAGFDDLDNDGDLDAIVLNVDAVPTVLRNDSDAAGNWLEIELRGRITNRDAVGSRVRVLAGDLVQVAEVHSGRGYQSHFGTRLHFGLANRDRVDRMEVRWLGGATEIFTGVPANQRVVLVEGTGRAWRIEGGRP
jgi:hypothetical protein